mmetsp:Transcript_45822/g.67184  ORF Transcript_45822/g.67184 Transcript_45822/m.67184 type:complete len:214 (+) Transcript_45822:84-725(+)
MRSKNGTTNEKLLGSRRSMSVPPGGGKAFDKLQKILADSTPKWKSVTANECGRTFGERNSATLGANLFRQEREATMQYKMRTVEAILKAFGDGNSELDPVLAASRSMLPSLNPSNSKLKLGAGYIKVDLSAAEHGINVFTAVRKPLRGRDTGGMSPPIKHKARMQRDASDAEEFRALQALYSKTQQNMNLDETRKSQDKQQRRLLHMTERGCA